MNIKQIVSNFKIDGSYISFKTINSGHVNSTFEVLFNENNINKTYILQRINSYVFKNPELVINNAIKVTKHIKEKNTINTITYIESKDNKYFYKDSIGDYYRMYLFIEGSVTYDSLNDLSLIEEEGKGFGAFQKALSDFDESNLETTIKDFHNTKYRYDCLKELIEKDEYNRLKSSRSEVDTLLNLESLATEISINDSLNLLTRRVVHNDTKCNNILFDKITNKYSCVIDLDTVMPGLLVFDFGDAIRSVSNNGLEDDSDLSNVYLDLDKFEAFSKGFLKETKDTLKSDEVKYLSLGAISMTLEVAVRFLSDYLDNDKYFHTSYKEHNLVRAKAQITLALDMIKKKDEMDNILFTIINGR